MPWKLVNEYISDGDDLIHFRLFLVGLISLHYLNCL